MKNKNKFACPKCGVGESHPNGKEIQIRALKVTDEHGRCWSQCLVCSGGYDKPNGTFNQSNHNPNKGWFSLDEKQLANTEGVITITCSTNPKE